MRILEWFKGLFKKAEPEKRKYKFLTEKEKKQILVLKNTGTSQREIAKKFNTSQAAVSVLLQKERKENELRTKKRSR